MTLRGSRTGFTLIEVIIVLVILGLAAGLVMNRGPSRSRGLEATSAAADVARMLRAARGQAIASDHSVLVLVDLARHAIAVDGGPVRVVPANLGLSVVAVADETLGARLAGIRFQPDGSASGGRITLADGKRRIEVGVDWLTGRVTIGDVRS